MAEQGKIRVLIVDDITETRDNLEKLLFFEKDIEVVAKAGTGREAVAMAKQHQPDVVLMDINMPDMDGMEATIYLKNSAFQHIPVIAQHITQARQRRQPQASFENSLRGDHPPRVQDFRNPRPFRP